MDLDQNRCLKPTNTKMDGKSLILKASTRGVMKTSVIMDVDRRPVEKLSLVDIDHEKLIGVDVRRLYNKKNVFLNSEKFKKNYFSKF